VQAIVHACDDCGKTIEERRTRLEVTVGAPPAQIPIDIGTGRPTLDLCAGCRDELVSYFAGRKAASGSVPTATVGSI
jgi:hypothetical protein